MGGEMTNKAKMAISIATVALIALIAVVAIIAIFANSKQTFTTSINISYKSTQVAGTAKGNYWVGATSKPMEAKKSAEGEAEGDNTLHFNADDQALDGATLGIKSGEKIELSTDNDFVVFEFIFTNTSGNDYEAVLTYTSTIESNFAVDAISSKTKVEQAQFASTIGEVGQKKLETGKTVSVTVPKGGEEAYIYVRIKISDIGTDATFNGNFSFDLHQAQE